MRIAIVGIGGGGGYFGGKLAREYENSAVHEVIFIARGEHLKAIQEKGLQLYTREGDYIARPKFATDDPAKAGIFDLVIFCTKSYSLESSALSLKANIHKNTVVIPLLNGVNITERLRKVLPDAYIVKGLTYIASVIESPGVIRQTDGSCKLFFGTDTPLAKKYQYILDILIQAKIKAELTGKISSAMWTKFLLICPLAGLTTATGETFGGIIEDPRLKNMLWEMMKEVKSIADARKIELPENIIDKTLESISRFAHDTKTSMQIDRERGRDTEIDIFTQYIIESGKDLSITTPMHNEIYLKLKM